MTFGTYPHAQSNKYFTNVPQILLKVNGFQSEYKPFLVDSKMSLLVSASYNLQWSSYAEGH